MKDFLVRNILNPLFLNLERLNKTNDLNGVFGTVFVASVCFSLTFSLLLSLLFSKISGWSGLARYYRDNNRMPEAGEKFAGVSAGIGPRNFPINYNHCLSVIMSDDGIRIRPWFFLRPFHSFLFIPWETIQAEQKEKFFLKRTILTIKKFEGVVALRGRAGQAVWEKYQQKRTGI